MNFKTLFVLLGFTMLLGSCATAYKTGQTPDDVYNSLPPPQDEYANVRQSDDKRYRDYEAYDDEDDYADYDDRYLRMKVRNRYLWSDLDDWYYYGGRYDYSYYNNWYYWNDPFYWNSPWSPVGYWNMYYNPYYPGWGWYGGLGLGYAWGWGGGYYNPWYTSWYGGWGWYDPWYTGWWGSPYYYGYGPGIIVGSRVNYQQRRVNLNTYNPNILNGRGATDRSAVGGAAGRRVGGNGTTVTSRSTGNYGTYGIRSDRSVNTNPGNSSAQGRVNALRDRFSRGNDYNSNNAAQRYNRSSRTETYRPSIDNSRSSTPSYSPPASSGGGGGRASGGTGGGSGRRF
ncbi:hypothetical protein A8C56_00485 [Niabella ginsenosidivorans]|uniref:Prolyl-tRNA synthetase n=1 Tax=Niabella ginsenosidivorans TaxID=1176587 RepID=A0A1A9HYT9_9BACT|nr:hypothetical protein [Niabella ginsenosidivorans]ANH79651.1 hypothetical protein A8C56_00485 [Niabella ginsenosidivorans]